jgi:hypothetical protein
LPVAGPSRTQTLPVSAREELPFPAQVAGPGRASVTASAHARACAVRPGDAGGVKKGQAFERQRRKMAATTGSGERGRRVRRAEGVQAGSGPGTHRGLCSGAGVSEPPPAAGLRGRDSHGPAGEEEQAVAGSTGGGLRGPWAARPGLKAPPAAERPAEGRSRAPLGPGWARARPGVPGEPRARGPLKEEQTSRGG